MKFYGFFLGKAAYPFLDRIQGTKLMETIQHLENSQHLSLEVIEKDQRKHLAQLLDHAYRTVPYYNRTFKELRLRPEDIRNVEDLEKLPPLTKKTINSSGNDMLSDRYEGKTILYHTGGSTGEPLEFYVTKEMLIWGKSAIIRARRWADIDMGEKQALLWGSSFDKAKHKKIAGKLKDAFHRRRMLDCFSLTEDKLSEYVRALSSFKPKSLRGYSSPLHLMSRYIMEKGLELHIPIIFTTAEKLHDFQRKDIEEAFNGEVFDEYGGRESCLLANECKEHQGHHVSIENAVLETTDQENAQVTGELGKFLLTDLHNYAMPFIRYEVGDAGTWAAETCACGVNLPLLSKLEGRMHHFIVTSNNNFIPGEFFPHLMKDAKGVKEFQIVQKTAGKATLYLVVNEKYSEQTLLELLETVEEYGHLQIELKYVDDIELPPSGKRLFTISEVPVKFT